MFSGRMSESSSPEVNLREIDHDTLEHLLEYLYTGDAGVVARGDALTLLHFADMQVLSSLSQIFTLVL